MVKVLKWIGIGLGGLMGVLILAGAVLSFIGNSRLNERYEIQPPQVFIPADEAALERGAHLVEVTCKDCHGEDLSGKPLMEDPAIGTIYASNLTSGKGGIGLEYSDADYVRAIRHGVNPDSRKLLIMPAESFIHFSAEDLGAIVAYLKTAPPVDNELPEPSLSLPGRILLAAGLFGQPFPAEYIDHSQPFPDMPAIAADLSYGAYLGQLCKSCHGPDLAGQQPPDPASPYAPDLTTGGELIGWTESDFIQTLRTGVTPSGRGLDPAAMPWKSIGKLHDDELKALWVYFQSLPPRAAEGN